MGEYYSIGKVSKKCNVTIKTLRFYDKIKLLQPEYRDEKTNYRYYTKSQMNTVLIIRRLRALGISTNKIREVISKPSINNYISIIDEESKNLKQEIEILESKKSACDVILSRMISAEKIKKEKTNLELSDSIKDVKVEYIEPSKLLYSRKAMKNYNNADVSLDRWIDIYEKCTESGITMTSPITIIYHTKPLEQFLMQDCDVEFGILIDPEKEIKKETAPTRAWGGFDALTAYHTGKYSEIIRSHVALIQYINKNNFEVAGPISEIFITSPLDIQDDEKHIIKIIIPITQR